MSIDAQVIPELAEWLERWGVPPAESARRSAARKQREAFRRRRVHGLLERHADRLVRIRGYSGPFPPDPESSEW